MKVVTFLLTVMMGIAMVSSTYLFFGGIQQDFSSTSSIATLKSATSIVASNTLIAYNHAKDSSFYSRVEPAAEITFDLPKRIGESNYKINLTGNSVLAWSSKSNNTVSTTLPFESNSSGLIDSMIGPHVIKAYRTNSDTVIFIIS